MGLVPICPRPVASSHTHPTLAQVARASLPMPPVAADLPQLRVVAALALRVGDGVLPLDADHAAVGAPPPLRVSVVLQFLLGLHLGRSFLLQPILLALVLSGQREDFFSFFALFVRLKRQFLLSNLLGMTLILCAAPRHLFFLGSFALFHLFLAVCFFLLEFRL